MPTGKAGNDFDPLPLPILATDERAVIRGTKTYRAPAIIAPTLCSVAFTAEGAFERVAVTDNPDGNWKMGPMPTILNGSRLGWSDVIWVEEYKKFFACGGNGSNNNEAVCSSEDGLHWWGGNQVIGYQWRQIVYAPAINTLAVVADVGPTTTARIATSTDGGRNWIARSLPTASVAPLGIAWSPTLNLFAIAGNANVFFTSPDGITWTSRTGPTTSKNWFNGVWAGGTINKFFFTTYDFAAGPAQSADGINWTNTTLAAGGLAQAGHIAFSPDLNMLIFVDDNNAGLCYSTDGTNWGHTDTGLGASKLHGVCWSSYLGLWVITTEGGPVLTSPNGTTWTIQTPINHLQWQRIAASR